MRWGLREETSRIHPFAGSERNVDAGTGGNPIADGQRACFRLNRLGLLVSGVWNRRHFAASLDLLRQSWETLKPMRTDTGQNGRGASHCVARPKRPRTCRSAG